LFAIGFLAGAANIVMIATDHGLFAVRSVWTIIQTCLILGSIFFATGLLGEQIAVLRSEQRELRRLVDERRAPRDR